MPDVSREIVMKVKYVADPGNAKLFADHAEAVKKMQETTAAVKLNPFGGGKGPGGGVATMADDISKRMDKGIKEAQALADKANKQMDAIDAKRQKAQEKLQADGEKMASRALQNRNKLAAQIGRDEAKRAAESAKAQEAALDKITEGHERAKDAAIGLGKAVAYWGIAGSDSAESMVTGLLKVKAAIEGSGAIDIIRGMRQAGDFSKGGRFAGVGKMARAGSIGAQSAILHGGRGLASGLGLGGVGGSVGAIAGAGAAAVGGGLLGINGIAEFAGYNLGLGKGHGAQTEFIAKKEIETIGWLGRLIGMEGASKRGSDAAHGLGTTTKGPSLFDRFLNSGQGMSYYNYYTDSKHRHKIERTQAAFEAGAAHRERADELEANGIARRGATRGHRYELEKMRGEFLHPDDPMAQLKRRRYYQVNELSKVYRAQNAPGAGDASEATKADWEQRVLAIKKEELSIAQQIAAVEAQKNAEQTSSLRGSLSSLREQLALHKAASKEAQSKIDSSKQAGGKQNALEADAVKRLMAKIREGGTLSQEDVNSEAAGYLESANPEKFGKLFKSRREEFYGTYYDERERGELESDYSGQRDKANASTKEDEDFIKSGQDELFKLKQEGAAAAEKAAALFEGFAERIEAAFEKILARQRANDTAGTNLRARQNFAAIG